VDAAALGGAGACVFMGMYANTKKMSNFHII
jgi:hypothetical protein